MAMLAQQDALYGVFSVYETLLFASKLKNGDDFDHKSRIDEILHCLDIKHCADVRVNKLSGGQKRRVAISCELVSHPDILFLDEPTSG